MTRHRFFVDGPLEQAAMGNLDEGRSRQVTSVLRLGKDDRIVVFDGSGLEAEAVITGSSRRGVDFLVESISRPVREPSVRVTMGLALLKGDRFEGALQKLTEIGVREVVPLTAERCVVSFRDARDWEKRASRYRRIIVEALEQSERVVDVQLAPPTSVQDFLERQETIALVERGHGAPLARVQMHDDVAIATGPEGGWSEREHDLIGRYARSASLGALILRADTAAIVSAATIIQQSYRSSDFTAQQGDEQRGS